MSEHVARALLEIGAVGFTPDDPITFKSGILSPVYVDNRRLPYHPAQWRVVVAGLRDLILANDLRYDVIAGVAMGGIPHSAALAYTFERPSVFIRKAAKQHGKGQRIEGGAIAAKHVLLIEDLVTTGGSSLSAVAALREADAICNDVVAIVSYGFAEARGNFEKAAVNLHTLTNFEAILRAAVDMQKLDSNQYNHVATWFDNPHDWAGKFDRS